MTAQPPPKAQHILSTSVSIISRGRSASNCPSPTGFALPTTTLDSTGNELHGVDTRYVSLGDLNGWISALVILITCVVALVWDAWKYRRDKRIERHRERCMVLIQALDMESRGMVYSEHNPQHRFIIKARKDQVDYEEAVQIERGRRRWWNSMGYWIAGAASAIKIALLTAMELLRHGKEAAAMKYEEWHIKKSAAALEEKTRRQREVWLSGYDVGGPPRQRDRSSSRTRKYNSEKGRRWFGQPWI